MLSRSNADFLSLHANNARGRQFFHVYAEIDFPNGNPRYSCENGFLIDRDTQTLLYAAPSSQGQPIPAVRRLGDSALDNWKPAGNEIRLPDTLESIGPYALDGQYTGDFPRWRR